MNYSNPAKYFNYLHNMFLNRKSTDFEFIPKKFHITFFFNLIETKTRFIPRLFSKYIFVYFRMIYWMTREPVHLGL